jgi:formylglycine-generating enzyme required for sulfatase activity
MGSDEFYLEEHSVPDVTISQFCLSKYEITNEQFRQFVEATDYITVAERPLSVTQFPNLTEKERSPGSVVFQIPKPLPDGTIGYLSWWHWVAGANWQHPEGHESDLVGRGNHPVVHIAYEDALAYAQWANASLPTEAQWEFAARGGLKKQIFTWGNQYSPKKANTWQGKFPLENKQVDGYFLTAPVGSFPPNAFGLYDMHGNVWEWCEDSWHEDYKNAPNNGSSWNENNSQTSAKILRGGSWFDVPWSCRSAYRDRYYAVYWFNLIGFRVVLFLL